MSIIAFRCRSSSRPLRVHSPPQNSHERPPGRTPISGCTGYAATAHTRGRPRLQPGARCDTLSSCDPPLEEAYSCLLAVGCVAFRAGVAQLVEHLICNQTVGGSSPFASSSFFSLAHQLCSRSKCASGIARRSDSTSSVLCSTGFFLAWDSGVSLRVACPPTRAHAGYAQVAEWLMAADCKSAALRSYGGSNPPLCTITGSPALRTGSVQRPTPRQGKKRPARRLGCGQPRGCGSRSLFSQHSPDWHGSPWTPAEFGSW